MRKTQPGDWWAEEQERGPYSDYARYAFGYSDKKPPWTYWLIVGGMVAYILYRIFIAGLP